jgi:anti-sigma B factor antagonist
MRPRREIMELKIEERLVGDVTVLDIVGRLTTDQGAEYLKDKINSLIAQQRTDIVLNLKNVSYIDSGGLGQLAASYGSVMKTGGAMKLLSVNSRNHNLLSITRLVTLFESFDSEVEAVRSFETVATTASLW